MYRFTDLVFAMGIGWALLGVFMFVISRKEQQKKPVSVFFLILAFSFPLLDQLVKPHPPLSVLMMGLFLLLRNVSFLTGPFIFYYSRSILKRKSKSRYLSFLHLFPFALWLILNAFFIKQLPLLAQGRGPGHPQVSLLLFSLGFIRNVLSILSLLLYAFFSWIEVRKHSRGVKSFYSSKTPWNTLSWLHGLLLLIMPVMILTLVFFILQYFHIFRLRFPFYIIKALPSLLFLLFFTLFSSHQNILKKDPDISMEPSEKEKYQKSSLSDDDQDKVYNELIKYLETEKPYLDCDLTIEELAQNLGYTRHHISQIINSRTNGNFYQLINRFRLKEFFFLLESGEASRYTLVALAFQCGFRSSSTFYSFFKKETGKTPREYIQSA